MRQVILDISECVGNLSEHENMHVPHTALYLHIPQQLQAPLSMIFSRQEYWSELPFPPPGYLPDQGVKSASPALACGFFITEQPGKPWGLG